jgi:hypothetical protein
MDRRIFLLSGMVLVIAGIVALIYQGVVRFNQPAGVEANPLPPILAGSAVAAGLVLFIIGSRHHIIAYLDRRRQAQAARRG